MTAVKAISSKTVFDSVGVCTHIDFNKWGYQNLPVTIAAINYTGIKHIRECIGNPSDLTGPRAWSVVNKATNAAFLAFIGETDPASGQQQLDMYAPMAAQGFLEFVEGPNEWDDAYPVSRGTTLPLAVALQQKVWAVGQTLKLPVVNISFGSGWTAANNWHGNYDKVGDLSQWCDFGNAHTYPSVGQSPEASLTFLESLAKMAAASRPVMHSEFGFNSSQGFTPSDMARFDLFAILDSTLHGCRMIYFYALFDDGSGLFGLMNQDGTPKLSGTAIRNFLALIADTGASPQDSLDISFTGKTVNDRSLLTEKADGRFLLWLWNEKDAAHNVTVSFTSPIKTVNIYNPIAGTAVQSTLSNVSQAVVSVPTHPVLVEIIGANVVTPPPPPPLSTQVPISIALNPASLTLPDNSVVGMTVALVSVTCDDGKPFAGTLSVTGPFKLAGSVVLLNGPLTAGTPVTGDVTATENGVSVKATLAVNVIAAPPQPLQTPTVVTFTPASAPAILDNSPAGTIVGTVNVGTSDGLAFTGTMVCDEPRLTLTGRNISLTGAAPTAPATFTGNIKCSNNGVDMSAPFVATFVTAVPVPPPGPITQTPNPKWGPPSAIAIAVGGTLAIAGLAISDQWAVGHAGTCALNVDTNGGLVSMMTGGVPIAGNARLRLSLNLSDANAALATFTYTAPPTVGTDTIKLTFFDQAGKSSSITIPVTII